MKWIVQGAGESREVDVERVAGGFEVSIDGGDWKPLASTDGLLDETGRMIGGWKKSHEAARTPL